MGSARPAPAVGRRELDGPGGRKDRTALRTSTRSPAHDEGTNGPLSEAVRRPFGRIPSAGGAAAGIETGVGAGPRLRLTAALTR